MATVKVDLPKKLVTITTKPGKTLSNVKFKDVVTYSGYTMGKSFGKSDERQSTIHAVKSSFVYIPRPEVVCSFCLTKSGGII